MWFERFVIIVTSLHRDYLPSSWIMYSPPGLKQVSSSDHSDSSLPVSWSSPVYSRWFAMSNWKRSSNHLQRFKKQTHTTLNTNITHERTQIKIRFMASSTTTMLWWMPFRFSVRRFTGEGCYFLHSPHSRSWQYIGLARTRISITCFLYGMTGCSLALLMMYYMNIFGYLWILVASPASPSTRICRPSFPVTFESTVLCAAHGMVITFLLRSKLLPGVEPHVIHPRMADDHFVMAVQVNEQRSSRVENQLRAAGAIETKSKTRTYLLWISPLCSFLQLQVL